MPLIVAEAARSGKVLAPLTGWPECGSFPFSSIRFRTLAGAFRANVNPQRQQEDR